MSCKNLISLHRNQWKLDQNIIKQVWNRRTYQTTATNTFSVLPSTEAKKIENTDVESKLKYVNPLRLPDYFEVNNLFTIKDLFDARVHLGHKLGSLNDKMRPYIFGERFGHIIFDLEKTAVHLRKALNIAAHIAYRNGIILFASNYHQHCPLIEQTAIECQEYAHTRFWRRGTFTNSVFLFQGTIRHPDLCIILNTLNDVLNQHNIVSESAKMSIPSIAIVDSNCDPTVITYPVPGNDDSTSAIELYLNLFKQAILKGKEVRKKEMEDFGKSSS